MRQHGLSDDEERTLLNSANDDLTRELVAAGEKFKRRVSYLGKTVKELDEIIRNDLEAAKEAFKGAGYG